MTPAANPSVRCLDGTKPVELSIGRTVPVLLPIALAMATPASLPPARLSDWMLEMPMLVSVRSPSMVMILMPLALAAFNGAGHGLRVGRPRS